MIRKSAAWRRGMKTAACICMLAAMLLLLSGCGRRGVFDGSRVSDATEFRMEYSVLDREESADLDLAEGDRLRVVLSHTEGTVDLAVGLKGKDPVYRGSGQQNAGFDLEITETGRYHISVTGHRAKGGVSFARIPAERE